MSMSVVDEVLAELRSAENSEFAANIEVVAQLCDVEIAAITVKDGDHFHLPLTHGIPPMVCDTSETLLEFAMSTDEVLAVADVKRERRLRETGVTNGALPEVRFYASAPIRLPRQGMIGRLFVADSRPKQPTPLQIRTLETLAFNLSSLIELRLVRRELTRAPRPPAGPPPTGSHLGAQLSHDLRVPLSAIKASIEMLGDELTSHPDPIIRALLDRSARAADRMQRMLELHMQPATPEREGTPVQVDLDEVARQVALDLAPMLEAKRATLVIKRLPVVQALPDAMYSVLQNLIENAVKYNCPGTPPRITVHSMATDGGLRVSVRDNGIGIPPEQRASVFTIFSRGDPDAEGHGIGLATVARVVQEYGGRVGVDEAPGGGAEVWFELLNA